jgi:hypothetical protein
MGETSYQVERHIRETRNNLGENISELEHRVKDSLNWRSQFEKRPMAMIALAFGGGALVSVLLTSSGRHWENRRPNSGARDFTPSGSSDNGKRGEAYETMNALKNALVAAAVTNASGYIEEVLPGFKQELDKTALGATLNSNSSTAGRTPQQTANEQVLQSDL